MSLEVLGNRFDALASRASALIGEASEVSANGVLDLRVPFSTFAFNR